ncbi:hypothetical protein Glove_37g132 [Diversispora epigaea]|uniref:Protein kinase domain-containing protein n=1 Tax=Diversispora epigaea TaxID=1348612 RepID=A0A397JN08_9GLOM|nr:hypothetical protein Glove_37g132 [Diversispora epigaea]
MKCHRCPKRSQDSENSCIIIWNNEITKSADLQEHQQYAQEWLRCDTKRFSENVYKATFKISQNSYAHDKSTLTNLISDIEIYRKLKIHDSILKFENTDDYMIILEYANNGYLHYWNYNRNLRPYISQSVKNLSEIIISETPQLPPHDATTEIVSVKDETISNKFGKAKSTQKGEVNESIKDLFEPFIDLIFYSYGIGTVIDNEMEFEFFSLAANEIVETGNISFSNLSLRKL